MSEHPARRQVSQQKVQAVARCSYTKVIAPSEHYVKTHRELFAGHYMPRTCPAHDLFARYDVHEMAASSLSRSGGRLLAKTERAEVLAAVSRGLTSAGIDLQRGHAVEGLGLLGGAAASLAAVPLTQEQKDSVIKALDLISDPRVQEVGRTVAQALGEDAPRWPRDLRLHVEERLVPRLPDLARLGDELLPPALREAWAPRDFWALTLSQEHVKAMGALEDAPVPGELVAVRTSLEELGLHDRLAFAARAEHLIPAVAEQARALAALAAVFGRASGRTAPLPPRALPRAVTPRSTSGSLPPCVAAASRSVEKNFVAALFCPLKYGASGLEALLAVPELMRRRRTTSDTGPGDGPQPSPQGPGRPNRSATVEVHAPAPQQKVPEYVDI
jgi:hypothetical protein